MDADGIRARLKKHHSGELVDATVELPRLDPGTVTGGLASRDGAQVQLDVVDNSSDVAVKVLETVCRRMEGRVNFRFQSPWQLGWPGDEGSKEDTWDVERRHLVVTRARVMFMPPRVLPVIVDPDGDVDDPGDSGGGRPRNEPKPPTQTP